MYIIYMYIIYLLFRPARAIYSASLEMSMAVIESVPNTLNPIDFCMVFGPEEQYIINRYIHVRLYNIYIYIYIYIYTSSVYKKLMVCN